MHLVKILLDTLFPFLSRSRADDFPTVEVVYPSGQKPRLIMLDDDEAEVDNLSITRWNTDAIRDYLKENLKA